MRELEFLPEWYPRIRQRSRVIKLQGWIMVLLIVSIGAWLFQTQRAVGASQGTLRNLKSDLERSQAEQQLLDEQLHLRAELQEQEQLIASLGYPVEMTRLLQTLDSLMPKEMSLTEFDCQTEEIAAQPTGMSVVRGGSEKKQINRRMKVKLAGVAPSDVDVANLLARLTNVLFFQDVALALIKGKSENDGHVFREFEITFWIDLNCPTGN
jgi:Tfp pilus assembly protein PilN